jgi:hypothetical protein
MKRQSVLAFQKPERQPINTNALARHIENVRLRDENMQLKGLIRVMVWMIVIVSALLVFLLVKGV